MTTAATAVQMEWATNMCRQNKRGVNLSKIDEFRCKHMSKKVKFKFIC